MAGGMCKNCAHWSSTDQVWGDCAEIVSDYPNAPKKIASINLICHDGEAEADFWTREDFGCRAWSSLKAVLKRIDAAQPAPTSTDLDHRE